MKKEAEKRKAEEEENEVEDKELAEKREHARLNGIINGIPVNSRDDPDEGIEILEEQRNIERRLNNNKNKGKGKG